MRVSLFRLIVPLVSGRCRLMISWVRCVIRVKVMFGRVIRVPLLLILLVRRRLRTIVRRVGRVVRLSVLRMRLILVRLLLMFVLVR